MQVFRANADCDRPTIVTWWVGRQYPGQKARIDAAFAETMQTIPDNPARVAGIALGEKIAAALFAERQSDATNAPDTYRPLTTPGVWVPTTPPLFPQYATAKPWGMLQPIG